MHSRSGSTQQQTDRARVSDVIGVVVVDDQAVFREVAREVIETTKGFEFLGDAASGPSGLRAVAEFRPDLALLDVRMPGMNGADTAMRLRAEHPEAVVVLLSVEDAPNLPPEVFSCGAAELVRKQ